MRKLDFSKVVLAIVGDIILDIFRYVEKDRPSAEDLGAFCYTEAHQERLAGGIGTTARCAVGLGGQAEVYGASGIGHSADQLRETLQKVGIVMKLVRVEGRPTTVKDRVVEKSTNRQIAVLERQVRTPVDDWAADALVERVRESQAQVVVVSDFDRGVVTPRLARGLSESAQQFGRPLIVDARPRPLAWYREHFPYLSLITPNRREAEGMLGRSLRTEPEIDRAGRELREALRCSVLITLSEQGARLYEFEGGEHAYTPTNGHEVVCVAGAGDTMVATIGLCLGAGMTLHEACVMAQYAAGVTVMKPGTEVVTQAELEAALSAVV